MENNIKVPYIDLAGQHARIKDELMSAIETVLLKGQFILGEVLQQFETEFAKLCGVKHAIGVNSGTDALILSLRVLGVGCGDEVITTPNSFVASATAAALLGATPVFVDVSPDYLMDPTKLESAITSKTKAVMPVHLTGKPCEMDKIVSICSRRGVPIVEDCAQAVCAEYHGRPVGSLGKLGCFSLHPLKTLNACGDGGVITTDDDAFAEELKIMRNIGLKTRDDCVMWSGNSRLDNIQAAILLVKLKHLEHWTDKRRQNAAFYFTNLRDTPGILLPIESEGVRSVYHTFVVRVKRRQELQAHLREHGIETVIHYPVPIHLHRAAAKLGHKTGDFPVCEEQANEILSLPVHEGLTSEQLQYVATTIKKFYLK